MADPLYIDAVGGTPEYNAKEMRQAAGGMYAKGVANPFSARPGIVPNSDLAPVAISGMTVTVRDLNIVFAPDIADPRNGPYLAAIPTANLAVTTAHGSLERRDIVFAKVNDDVIDGSGSRDAVFGIADGTPGSGTDASIPTGSVPLARVTVPAGSSTPSITDIAPRTVAAGGIIPSRSGFHPAAGRFEGLYIDDSGTDKLYRWNGSSFETMASAAAFSAADALRGYSDSRVSGSVNQTTTGTFQSLGGGPAVTVQIPGSGRAKIQFGARFIVGTTPGSGSDTVLLQLQLVMTGANTGVIGGNNAENRNIAPGRSAVIAAYYPASGLNSGSTTFTLQYYTSSGGPTAWSDRYLDVEPRA